MQTAQERGFLTPAELAACVGVHRGTVLKWVRQKDIPAERLGGRILIPRSAVSTGKSIKKSYSASAEEVTPHEAAAILDVHLNTVFNYVRNGTLPHRKRRRRVFIPRTHVNKLAGIGDNS